MHKCRMKIVYQDELPSDGKELITHGLSENAVLKKALGKNDKPFSFILYDHNDDVYGGMSGFNYYGCFHIDLLFIKPEARNKNYGMKLMEKAEALARERNCLFMAVNTMDFEAKPFYEKNGFSIEFIREGFEKESRMYFLRKQL